MRRLSQKNERINLRSWLGSLLQKGQGYSYASRKPVKSYKASECEGNELSSSSSLRIS